MYQAFSSITSMGKRPKPSNPPMPKLYLGEWIDAVGAERKHVAKAAGVDVSYVNNLIGGHKDNPTVEKLHLMATYLGCKLTDLWLPPPPEEVRRAISGLSEQAINALARPAKKTII